MTADTSAEIERTAALLDRRRQTGYVRQCHGDLHLRNIVLLDGEPTLFDAVEFNDEIACIEAHQAWHRKRFPKGSPWYFPNSENPQKPISDAASSRFG